MDSIGAALSVDVSLEQLSDDPYPFYRKMREVGRVVHAPNLGMYLVTRYEDVRTILLDTERFTTNSAGSLILKTFGEHMLTCDGPAHLRHRKPFQRDFMPDWIHEHLVDRLRAAARSLIREFQSNGRTELRSTFASRYPIQVMLLAFGLPLEDEARFRLWYDHFEAALANHAGLPQVQSAADRAAHEMREHFREWIEHPTPDSLLEAATSRETDLSSDEIAHNLSIIFFGGISTVEALVLNSIWLLLTQENLLAAITADRAKISCFLDETMRWAGPVQSATRFVGADIEHEADLPNLLGFERPLGTKLLSGVPRRSLLNRVV